MFQKIALGLGWGSRKTKKGRTRFDSLRVRPQVNPDFD